ncbi:hypothetical protein OG552_04675 [Streptomyces sp. NBC_01476]|uniref:hypothetical protein n=1 Tax=Streptomyces sp. NBC_01476 TaxID=2903881 RepID=UPI002E376341|nr:hypothetical protein [Streptomyces sp. NBC_01476]
MRSRRDSPAYYAAAVLLSPLLLVAGDPLQRAVRRALLGPRRAGAFHVTGRRARVLPFFSNQLVIALSAPSRWAGDRLRRP